METEAAILALAALAQPMRLEAFRHLIRHMPEVSRRVNWHAISRRR